MALSETKLRGLLNKKQNKRYDISDRDGLIVRVYQTGSLSFQYRYRFNGKESRLTLGRYPDLTLTQARNKVPELRQMLKDGKNPGIETKRMKVTKKPTLEQCIELFMDKHVVSLRESSQQNYKSSLVVHGIGVFNYPVKDITIHEWYSYFEKVGKNHSVITARTLLSKIKTCIRFCIARGFVDSSEVLKISSNLVGEKSKRRDRVPDIEELKLILSELEKSKCYPTTRNTLKFCLLTGARLGEVRRMEVSDIDFTKNIWTVPVAKSKTKTKIRRPLAPEALKIIKWQVDTFGEFTRFVFPSGSYKREISPQTVNKLSRAIREKANMEPWTAHDFRRSLATLLSKNKVNLQVTEVMLGHSLGGIIQNYNLHDWIDEQREAYELWEKIVLN